MNVSTAYKTYWKAYNEVKCIRSTIDRLGIKFSDGKKTTANCHMGSVVGISDRLNKKLLEKTLSNCGT